MKTQLLCGGVPRIIHIITMRRKTTDMELRYLAFISYRTLARDRTWARWILRDIEEISPHKFGRTEEKFRVFRDEDELSASSSLTASLQDALNQTEHLVVLHSETTLQSRWVQLEIQDFISRRRPILIVILSGDENKIKNNLSRDAYDQMHFITASLWR